MAALLGMFCPALWILSAASVEPSKPNIVLILADDVSPEAFSCYNRSHSVPTPHIDSIGREGVQFETCFAPASCGPSRALLMTGVYANTSGAFSNKIWAFDSRKNLFFRHSSWAKQLRENGYATAIAGKWHCNRSHPWSDEVGFDEYCLWETPERIEQITGSHPVKSGSWSPDAGEDRYWNSPMIQNGAYLPTGPEIYGPDVRCEFLLDFMERMAGKSTPFVAYWPTVLVHGPISRTPFSREDPEGEVDEEARLREMVSYLDHLVGRLVARTKELGIYENTWFLFAADNGSAKVAKNRGVESGVRVPLLISGPGVPATGATGEMTDFSDLAPTLLEIGGVRPEKHPSMDGVSLLSFLTGKTHRHREWIYSYAGPVQIIRTRFHLLEARSPLLDSPDGRLYHTGGSRHKADYRQIETAGDRSCPVRGEFEAILSTIPPHLCENHPYWETREGRQWLRQNPDLEKLARRMLVDAVPASPAIASRDGADRSILASLFSSLLHHRPWLAGNGHPLFLFPRSELSRP